MRWSLMLVLAMAARLLSGAELALHTPTADLLLKDAPAWHIASMKFPVNSFQIVPVEAIPLYQLEWFEKGALETLNSFQARVIRAGKIGDTLVLVFAHDKQRIQVECRAWITKDGILWDASFQNGSKIGKVGIFRYPGIAIQKSAGPLEAVLSVADGMRIRDALDKLRENESREWDYPGMLSSQMTAWLDKTGGVVLYTADSAGYYKRFRVLRYRDHLIPTFEHILVGNSGPVFAMPYKTVVAPFKGRWEEAADVYRKWAVRQPWCRKTLAEKKLPASVTTPSFILCSHIRLQTGKKVSDQSTIIPRFSEAYRQALGMPITNLFFSWEKKGPWVAPDYFPPYPNAEAFTRMSGLLHGNGNRTMVFLSGLNVTLEKESRGGAPSYRLDGQAQNPLSASAIVGRDLKIHARGVAKEGVGKHWVLCPTTDAARDQILDGVRKSLELKVDMIQIDQVVGGGVPPCFEEAHGHPWAGMNKMTQAFAGILKQAHDRTYAKGAALSLEEPGEYFIPYLDIVHAREWMQGSWPREGNGVEGISLFSYLYHDYLLGYGGDAQLLTGADNVEMAMYMQAMNLIAGRYPAGALWMRMPEYDQLAPQLQKVLVQIAGIWNSEARDFLMLGQARAVRYPSEEHSISYNVRGHSHKFGIPAILSIGYGLGNREIVLFINTTMNVQALDLRTLAGSKNLRTLWPAGGGNPPEAAKPVPVGSFQALILQRDKQ